MTFFWTVNLDNNYFVARAGGAVCSAQHGAAGAAGRGNPPELPHPPPRALLPPAPALLGPHHCPADCQ